MDSRSEMFRPFVPHHKFCPVHWKVKWVNWSVFMESWQLLHTVFIPGRKQIDSKSWRIHHKSKVDIVKSRFYIFIFISTKIKGALSKLTPHLESLMTSFKAWRRLPVLIDTISNTTPAPLLANFSALSGWSPTIGTITMGTAWHSPSKRPCEPAWVMKARAPGCANTQHRMSDVTVCEPSWASFRNVLQWIYTPSRSFWGTHFIIFTFSGTLSETCPVYLHITYKNSVIYCIDVWFKMHFNTCSYIPVPSVESVWRLLGRRRLSLLAGLTPWCPEWTL